jgi:hypothetical protein
MLYFCSFPAASPAGEDVAYVHSTTTRQTAARATTRLGVQCSGRSRIDMPVGLDWFACYFSLELEETLLFDHHGRTVFSRLGTRKSAQSHGDEVCYFSFYMCNGRHENIAANLPINTDSLSRKIHRQVPQISYVKVEFSDALQPWLSTHSDIATGFSI